MSPKTSKQNGFLLRSSSSCAFSVDVDTASRALPQNLSINLAFFPHIPPNATSLAANPSNAKHGALTRNTVEHARVIYGYVLLRNHLDDLLCHHPSRQRGDVVELRFIGSDEFL